MQLDKKNRPLYKKPIIWLAALLILAAIFVVLEKTQVIDFIKIPLEKDSPAAQEAEQKKADDARKQDFIEKTPNPTPTIPPQNTDAITLTAAQESSSVTVLTKLAGFSGGTCDLSITNGGKTFSSTADVIYQPEFSSCAGFSIPVAELGAGQWSITLKATPTGGSVLAKTISLEVN